MEKGFFSPSVRWFGWVRLGIMLCSLEEGASGQTGVRGGAQWVSYNKAHQSDYGYVGAVWGGGRISARLDYARRHGRKEAVTATIRPFPPLHKFALSVFDPPLPSPLQGCPSLLPFEAGGHPLGNGMDPAEKKKRRMAVEISLERGMKGISVRPWSSQFVFMLRGFVRFETPPPSNSTCVRLGGGGSAVQRRNGGSLEVRGRISPRNMVRPLRIFSEEGKKHRSAALKSKRCLFPSLRTG